MSATKKAEDSDKTAGETSTPKKLPKGGRKGGTAYPRLPLSAALEYSDKLVSKTHTGPQPASTILAGVFNNAGPIGFVRAASLRKYGLLEGEKRRLYGYTTRKRY